VCVKLHHIPSYFSSLHFALNRMRDEKDRERERERERKRDGKTCKTQDDGIRNHIL
jgi:hypothetical protein